MSKKLLLVVDDNDDIRQLFHDILDSSYTVVDCENGNSCLSILDQVSPNIMLLDISLPDISGEDLFHLLKKSSKIKNILIIFITGKVLTESVIELVKNHNITLIEKPIKADDIKKAISSISNSLPINNQNDNNYTKKLGNPTSYNERINEFKSFIVKKDDKEINSFMEEINIFLGNTKDMNLQKIINTMAINARSKNYSLLLENYISLKRKLDN